MNAEDLLDPFPLSEGQRRAMELARRLADQRDHELTLILTRVYRNQQSAADVQRLAVELGIAFNPRPISIQD